MTRSARPLLPLLTLIGSTVALTGCNQDDQSAFAPICLRWKF